MRQIDAPTVEDRVIRRDGYENRRVTVLGDADGRMLCNWFGHGALAGLVIDELGTAKTQRRPIGVDRDLPNGIETGCP